MSEGSDVLPFTGERFLPEVSGRISYEHLHRYYFAMHLVKGMRVLDVACGEGYGSNIMSSVAKEVVGVDVAPDAVAHATSKYGSKKLTFITASAALLPFEDEEFDVVVSFETIEHLAQHEEMLGEVKRVLKAGGVLVISSPDKQHYSIIPSYQNPFHVKELFKEEFVALVGKYFDNSALMLQRVVHGSLIVGDNLDSPFETHFLDHDKYKCSSGLGAPLYDLIVASDSPLPQLPASLFEESTHGMAPADFYGVHLPERVAKADELAANLRRELALRPMPESDARRCFDSENEDTSQVVRDNRHTVQEQFAGLASVYQSVVTGLNDLVAEKEIRLEAAKHLALEREAGMAELRRHTDALSNLRGELEGELQDSRAQIAQLQAERKGNEALAAELRALIAEKETRLVTAGHALGQRDAAIAELRKHADALESAREQLKGDLQAVRSESIRLRADLEARDSVAVELRALIAEKETRLQTAGHALGQRDAAMAELGAHTRGLEKLRTELEAALQASHVGATGLETLVGQLRALAEEKDTQLATAGLELRARDAAMSDLERRAQELEDAVEQSRAMLVELHGSTSWRWTKPLRWTALMLRGSRQL